MIIDEEDYLSHYGILRKSGRYPWGQSGETPAQRSMSFFDHVAVLKAQGLSEAEIATGFGFDSTTQLRDAKTIARNAKKQADIGRAEQLRNKGLSHKAIGEKMGGLNESSVRSLLVPGQLEKLQILETVANKLREQVSEKKYLDIGSGVENWVGVTKNKLGTAVAILKDEGYMVHKVPVPQVGSPHDTEFKILTLPGTTQKEAWLNRYSIRQIDEKSEDGGRSFFGMLKPISVDPSRIAVTYGKDGGSKADGVIYVRPGAKELSIGSNHYSQVRISVDGTHYLKGMAIYKDGLPPGIDLIFNTNKVDTGNKLDAMKPLVRDKTTGKIDKDNPFGAIVDQIGDKNDRGQVVKLTSAMNIVNESGDWAKWNKNLSSQMLSKQSPALAKTQLDKAYDHKKKEFDEIMALTNPTVRKKLLETFSDGADSAATHLKAASLDRQGTHVILPINSLKVTEVYAPTFRDGERVALIRFPHGGTFEIPELIVNNKNPEAKRLLGAQAEDAIGIHHKVAQHLSGADFDGDTVLVIPNSISNPKIKTTPMLEQLKNFDPQSAYRHYEGMPEMTPKTKGHQMGDVSNLITDMSIQKAPIAELARAVRHSMVVIDAEKHHLNYKQSALDHGILQLKQKYQNGGNKGASTIVSRRKSELPVPERIARRARDGGPIDPKTGKKMYTPTNRTRVEKKINKKTGVVTEKVVPRTTRSTKLAEADDAHTLVSKNGGTPIERVYADHSNQMKALANEARRESVHTESVLYSSSAKKHYASEVASLNASLALAKRNQPLERQANVLANTTVRIKRQGQPDMSSDELKRIKSQALTEARRRTGAEKQSIEPTPLEWAAIQAGAITKSKLGEILDNSNLEVIKQLATPKTNVLMSTANISRAKALAANGATQSEIADALGVSLTTLKRGLGGE